MSLGGARGWLAACPGRTGSASRAPAMLSWTASLRCDPY